MGHNVLLKALTLCTNSRAVKQKFFDFYQPQCMFAASFFSHPYLRCPVYFLKQLFLSEHRSICFVLTPVKVLEKEHELKRFAHPTQENVDGIFC